MTAREIDPKWFCKIKGIGGHEWRRAARVEGQPIRLVCGYCGQLALLVEGAETVALSDDDAPDPRPRCTCGQRPAIPMALLHEETCALRRWVVDVCLAPCGVRGCVFCDADEYDENGLPIIDAEFEPP